MKIKSLLFSIWSIVLIISLPADLADAAPADTNNADFKTSILNSYLQRCVEVLNNKGYSSEAIKTECKCELDHIDRHFTIFQQMLAGSTADNQQQINNFKKQLLQCKVAP